MREITGTTYAVWVGIGASLTVTWAMITGDTDVSRLRILLILGLVGCIIGLNLIVPAMTGTMRFLSFSSEFR